MKVSHSAKLYQERKTPSTQPTHRIGGPRINLSANPVHSIQLAPPFPTAAVVSAEQRTQPDAGHTFLWPRGEITV
jgi:hypothetical protein